jgi:hypothetical protein
MSDTHNMEPMSGNKAELESLTLTVTLNPKP